MFASGIGAPDIIVFDVSKLALDSVRMPFAALIHQGGGSRAKAMAQIAEQAGLSREQLYRTFSENGNPTLKTMLAVMKAMGIELTARAAE